MITDLAPPLQPYKCRSVDLCVFLTVELPWAFGARKPGMRRHLPTPWYDRLRLTRHPNSIGIETL